MPADKEYSTGISGDKMLIGRHVSISPSISHAFENAESIGCTAMQIFTRNPRGWVARPLSGPDAEGFKAARRASVIGAVVAHMPYLPNLASPNEAVYKRSVLALRSELGRCELLGIDYLVVHLGSHLGKGAAEGRKRVAGALSGALGESGKTMLLMENEAGQKNSVGSTFEELAEIHDAVGRKKAGFCIDTCHAFAAGYDIRKTEIIESMVSALGKGSIRAMHVNDAKFGLGSLKDRHENIGFGFIGRAGFASLMSNSAVRGMALILETPEAGRISPKDEIALVRKLAERD